MYTQSSSSSANKEVIIHICSRITRARVLNGELYAKRLHKLIYLHLSTDSFMKISLQSTGLNNKCNKEAIYDDLYSSYKQLQVGYIKAQLY